MDRFAQFGLQGDGDEQFRRAFRDAFKRGGLPPERLAQGLEWYKDHVRPGMDAAKLIENFTAFANGKGWPTEHLDAALSVYSQVRDEGPGAVMEPVSAEADAATIAKATELMRTDPNAYWRNAELQEALFESLERQETDKSVPVETPPATAADAALAPDGGARAASPGRVVDQRRRGEIEAQLGDPRSAYWRGPQAEAMQQEYRNILEAELAPRVAAPAVTGQTPAVVASPSESAPVAGKAV
jgi:hypothetical protein